MTPSPGNPHRVAGSLWSGLSALLSDTSRGQHSAELHRSLSIYYWEGGVFTLKSSVSSEVLPVLFQSPTYVSASSLECKRPEGRDCVCLDDSCISRAWHETWHFKVPNKFIAEWMNALNPTGSLLQSALLYISDLCFNFNYISFLICIFFFLLWKFVAYTK